MRNRWNTYSLLLAASLILAGIGACAALSEAAETPVVVGPAGVGPEISMVRGELSKVQGNVIFVKGAAYQLTQETVILSETGSRTILPAGNLPRQVVLKYYLPETTDESVKPVAVEIQLLPVQAQ